MALGVEKAIEIIKNPRNKGLIESVKLQESQLRVFTEDLSAKEIQKESYYKELMNTIKTRSEKKFDRVCDFFRFPLPIIQDSDAILNDFFKVFDGKNRYFNVSADRDITRLNQWISDFRIEEWIEENMADVWCKKPNSFVVVDVNEKGPYLLNIDSERLVDAEFKNKFGQLVYIAFVHSVSREEETGEETIFYSVYDDEKYYVFSKSSEEEDYKTVSEVPHNIGYCPAHSFIRESTTRSNLFKRRVAFTKALSRMEDFTIFDVFNNYLDHYAPFPVTESPRQACQDQMCVDGKVPEQIVTDVAKGTTKTVWNECQTCEGGKNQGKNIGPGTHIGINVRAQGNDGSGVFKMHFPDTSKLEHIPKKLDGIILEIKNKVVGVNGMISKEAVNELQAKGGFESMESVVLRNKKELDELYKWIVRTTSRIFFKDIDVRVDANFGTEWYLSTEEDIQAKYDQAKKIGLPMEELMMIYIQLIETKYKGNNTKIERQKMLLQLDPLPLISVQESIELNSKGHVSDELLVFKINFLNFIAKFESENVPITQFGLALEMPKRIEIIKRTLNLYINEIKNSKSD